MIASSGRGGGKDVSNDRKTKEKRGTHLELDNPNPKMLIHHRMQPYTTPPHPPLDLLPHSINHKLDLLPLALSQPQLPRELLQRLHPRFILYAAHRAREDETDRSTQVRRGGEEEGESSKLDGVLFFWSELGEGEDCRTTLGEGEAVGGGEGEGREGGGIAGGVDDAGPVLLLLLGGGGGGG